MKAHTTDFENAIKQMGRELRGVITYNNITLEDEIMSITPHYEANLLKSVMKQLDLELFVDIPLETVINCQIGILVGEEYEMLNFGNYVVYSSEKQEDTNTYKIVCYDKLLYSMKQNEDLGVIYPISIKDYLTALANKIGLTVASGTFYNQNLMIPSELYVDLEYTYRDILDEIAQATGSIITLNANDEIEIKYPNNSIGEATISGTTLQILEHTGNKILNTNINGNSIQDTTPTTSNPVVIKSSGDSKNIYYLPEAGSSNGIDYTINSDGTINLSGTATTNTTFIIFKDLLQSYIENGEVYTFSSNQNLPSGVEFRLESFNSTSWQRHVLGSVLNSSTQSITNTANITNGTRIRYLIYITNGTTVNITNLGIQLEKGDNISSFSAVGRGFINEVISNSDNTQSQSFIIPCQSAMRSVGNIRDSFKKINGIWYEKHNIGIIQSYNGESITTDFISTTGELSNGAFVQYVLLEPNYVQCDSQQIQALNLLAQANLYTGITNISSNAYVSITYNLILAPINEEYLKNVNVNFAEKYRTCQFNSIEQGRRK